MEAVHATSTFGKSELMNPDVILNRHFLDLLEEDLRKSPVFDHPFLIRLSRGVYSERAVRHAFIQFSKHVRIFTGCLGRLIGIAPDIRDRLVLFDNLQEELGKGSLLGAHYSLYLRMLASMGISSEEIERAEPITALELLNDALITATSKSFIAGLAWLGLGGELTIPNNFPYLAQGARRTFAAVDTGFFERHGQVDQGHSDDSNLLLAMHLKTQAERDAVRSEATKSLYLRAAVWDELAAIGARL